MTPTDLTTARKAAKLTQRRCAALFGVNIRTFARWEAGGSRIPKLVQDYFKDKS